MEQKEYSRRKFIHRCAGCCSALVGSAFLLNSCGGNGKPEKSDTTTDKRTNADTALANKASAGKRADPCSDLSDVSAEELDKRKKFGYVDKSDVAGNSCGNCGLYIADAKNTECGRCLLFKGPVRAVGHCVQYVAKTTK